MNALGKIINSDEEIFACLNLDNPKSFFLFAGAGSGKTRSLVTALKRFKEVNLDRLKRNAQKVAIITYTNAASDEIKHRLDYDTAFSVSTIHSFSWELISPYTHDIRIFLKESLKADIEDLKGKQDTARSKTTQTYKDRERKIESKSRRLENLDKINKFSYNPNGDNSSKDSLNHAEVVEIAAYLLAKKPLMQNILTRKYPILLIDESQDTKKELVDAFFDVQKNQSSCFSLGMFGDVMQRIYLDGKENLGKEIPDNWNRPEIKENYRCSKRVVELINRIRKDADGQQQIAARDVEGIVRLFVVGTVPAINKRAIESQAASHMLSLTGDKSWDPLQSDFKILTLEHHMSAKRGGFSSFFDPLYEVDKFKTGLLDGSLSLVSLLMKQVLPLVIAFREENQFLIAKIVREYSPLLKREKLKGAVNQIDEVKKVSLATKALLKLWEEGGNPKLAEVLKEIDRSGIFQLSESLILLIERIKDESTYDEENDNEKDIVTEALVKSVSSSFGEFEKYAEYISDKSRFGTHQGVKGLQFPRVMVILDDEDARGSLFSYDKLFGAQGLSERDIQNQREGKETGLDRTRRLFYVTCSRAQESLAIMAFTSNPQKVKEFALSQQWFSESEIAIM